MGEKLPAAAIAQYSSLCERASSGDLTCPEAPALGIEHIVFPARPRVQPCVYCRSALDSVEQPADRQNTVINNFHLAGLWCFKDSALGDLAAEFMILLDSSLTCRVLFSSNTHTLSEELENARGEEDSERVSSVDIEANQNARFDKSSSLSLLTLPGINMRFISDSI
ncbi:unnamed protein product [Leuciscus chuanchicus]